MALWAPAAHADHTWTPPAILTPRESDAEDPRVAIDANGAALAVWTTQRFSQSGGTFTETRGAFRPAGGNFEPLPNRIVYDECFAGPTCVNTRPPRVVMNSRGDAAVLTSIRSGTYGYVEVSVRPAGGTFGGAYLVGRIGDCGGDGNADPQAEVAIDENGDALVVWNGATTTSGGACPPAGDVIYARRLTNLGRDLRSPVQVAGGSDAKANPHVAFDPQGNALVLWQGVGGIKAGTQAAGTATWSAPTTVSSDGGVYPFVTFNSQGDAIATWQSQGENAVKATLRPTGQGFSALPSPFSGVSDLGIAPRSDLDTAGDAIASRLHFAGARYVAEAAYRPAGGAFTATTLGQSVRDAPRTNALPDDTPRAELDAQGDAMVAWRSYDGTVERVQAAERPAGADGSFTSRAISDYQDGYTCPSEPQAECPAGDFFGVADLAVNAHGDAVVVWARSDGANQRVMSSIGVPPLLPAAPGQPPPPPVLPPAPPPPPPPPAISKIQPARTMRSGEAVVLRADVSGDVSRLEWDFSFPNPRIVGTIVDGALQRSVRFRPPAGQRFTVTVKAVGPGGSETFTRSLTAPRAPGDARADRVRKALDGIKDAAVFAVGSPDVLTGKAGTCGPVSVITGRFRLGGCIRPVDDLADIQLTERGVLDPLARALGLNGADGDLMRRAVELTDGYVAQGRALMNGVWPVVPSGNAAIAAFTQAKAIASSNASLTVGGIPIRRPGAGFLLNVDPHTGDIPLGAVPRPPSLPTIAGFKLVGDFNIDLERQEARITARLKLPEFLKRAGVDIQSEIKLRATVNQLIIDELTVGPINVEIGALGVSDFQIRYIRAANEWQGQGKACVLSGYCLDMIPPNGGVKIKDGRLDFAGASLGFPPPGVPLFTGVNLERIGFGFGLNPTRFTGNARLTFGTILVIDGRMVVAFPSAATPFVLSRDEVGNDFPAKLYDYRYTRFTIGVSAAAALRVPAVGEVPFANAYALYEYPGYLALGGGVRFAFPSSSLALISLDGRLDGEINAGNGRFNFDGHVKGCVVDVICKAVDGNVSSNGMSVCTTVDTFVHEFHVGGAIRWRPFKFIPYLDGCQWGRFRQENVHGARAAQAGGAYVVRVARGARSRMVMMQGDGAAPRVRVTGPGGQVLESPVASELVASSDATVRIMRSEQGKFVAVGLARAAPGSYTIEPLPDSVPIASVKEASALADARVRAHVTGKGKRRILSYTVGRRPDQTVSFWERDAGGGARQLGSTSASGRGKLRFAPAPGRGTRRIEARFELDGVPAEKKVVARFRPPSPRLGKPRGLHVRRAGKSGLRVRWRRVKSATRYELAVTLSSGRQRFVTTRRRSALVKGIAKSLAGRLTVRAVDGPLRHSAPAAKPFKRTAPKRMILRPLKRCRVVKHRVVCRPH